MARTLLLVLLAAAAAEECVEDEVDIARIHATDDDAAADVVAAVLSDEAVVVEGVDDAFLTLLSEATNWTHHAGIREGLRDLVPSLRLVNGSADARWGCRTGGCRLRDMHKDAPLPTLDSLCVPSWRLQVEGITSFVSYKRTPAERGVSIGEPYVSSTIAVTTLKPGDLLIHPGGWRPYYTKGSKRALTGALALENAGKRLWSSPARVRARASGPAFPSKKLLEACPDVLSYDGFSRSVDEDEHCPLPSQPGSGCVQTPPPPKLKWPTSDIDVGYHAAPAAYDVDGDGDFDLVIGDAAGRVSYYENTGTSKKPQFEFVNSIHAHAAMAAPALADLDGDSYPELAVGGADPAIAFFNLTYEPFHDTLRLTSEWRHLGPIFVDVDDDGDLDLLVAASGLFDSVGLIKNVGSRTAPRFEVRRDGYANVRRLDLLGLEAPASRFAVGAPSYLDPENRTWVPTSSIAVGDEGHGLHYMRLMKDADPYLARTPLFWTAPLQDLDLEALGRSKTFPLPVHEAPAPCLADFNGDGVDDLILGGRYGTLLYFDGALPAPKKWGGRKAPPVPE
ncbi:unnamed protein product [Pelagomonas calceolata]|uniref:ASPIC/UnbV domain-containing protein n=1 Tax=Pelagomonas calceolata TaxID=35677 RepID=A0A8J2WZ05_9STRA|nr:unnamed protein product [Pelagomonas calceolata]